MADDPKEPVKEEEVVDPAPPTEDPKPAEEVEEPEEEVEEPEEEPEEEPAPPSRREQLRIQQVLERVKAQQQPTPPTPVGIDYTKDLEADPELIKKLEADRQAVGAAQYQAGIAQANTIKWETMLNVDAPAVEAKYSQLDKNSEDFHPALANAISTMYLSAAGFNPDNGTVANPNIRYRDYVEGFFEVADEIANDKTASTRKNIAKQAANTGLRPDGSKAKRLNLNQSPNAMSDEELNAKIESDLKALGLT